MKTKDFIKMLQEADPKGEGYIRLPNGGAPWFAESKPGYWDGSYQYLEKINPDGKNNWGNLRIVTSKDGYKIDIHTYDQETMIWDVGGNMDKIRKQTRIGDNIFYTEEEEKNYWDNVEEEAKGAKEYDDEFLYKRGYNDVMDNFFYDKTSWEVRQPLDKPIGMYHCMKAFSFFKIPNQLNQCQCDVIIRSGKFYPEKKKNYYVWQHDPDKGKDWSIK